MTTPMSRELIHVPFRDGEILAVEIDGQPWIVLRPAFAAIGIRADWQIEKLRPLSWATTCVTQVVADDGRTRDMIVSDVRTFLMALATIPSSRVSAAARPVLEAYQKEVAEAIEAYWTKGVAINPRAHASAMHAPKLLSLEEAAAVMRQVHGLDYTVVDLTRAMRSAGIIRLSGGPKKAHFNLLWWNGSAWHVVAEFLDILAGRLKQHESAVGLQLDHGVQLRIEVAS